MSQKNEALAFHQSAQYWDDRYRLKGNSGAGSYGHLADFKAKIINKFIVQESIQSVMEFGCGDGNQLSLSCYPKYIGFDVSPHAVTLCTNRFSDDKSKEFHLVDEWQGSQSELVLSLDVIYHLIEDDVFDKYMHMLFSAAQRFVIIYASNDEKYNSALAGHVKHVRHRKFTDWIAKNIKEPFVLHKFIPNEYPFDSRNQSDTSFADFFIFRRLKV